MPLGVEIPFNVDECVPESHFSIPSHPDALCWSLLLAHWAERNPSGTLIKATPPPTVYVPMGARVHPVFEDEAG